MEANLSDNGQMCLPNFICAWAHVPTCPDTYAHMPGLSGGLQKPLLSNTIYYLLNYFCWLSSNTLFCAIIFLNFVKTSEVTCHTLLCDNLSFYVKYLLLIVIKHICSATIFLNPVYLYIHISVTVPTIYQHYLILFIYSLLLKNTGSTHNIHTTLSQQGYVSTILGVAGRTKWQI